MSPSLGVRPSGHLKACWSATLPGSLLPARHDPGRTGCRQEPDDLRALPVRGGMGGLVVWRQGRCLPFGEGIALWALGEIVKAEAGILAPTRPNWRRPSSTDRSEGFPLSPTSSRGSGLGWHRSSALGRRARPDAMSPSPRGGGSLRGSPGPMGPSYVFEDLHWADQALLDFVKYVAGQAQPVPMLVVCTARTEFSERHPSWADGLSNATALNLARSRISRRPRWSVSSWDRAVGG